MSLRLLSFHECIFAGILIVGVVRRIERRGYSGSGNRMLTRLGSCFGFSFDGAFAFGKSGTVIGILVLREREGIEVGAVKSLILFL